LARHLAAHATVLAKNQNNLLPITKDIPSIAVIGDDAQDKPIYSGGGSGHVIAETWVTPLAGIRKRAGSEVQVTYANSQSIPAAVAAAKQSKMAVVFAGTTSSEGSDRPSLSLAKQDNDLITAVAAAQPNTVVVVHTPGAVLMPWASQVSSIVIAFLPGQEDGNAIADVLFGDVNPAARLPVTFPMTEQQIPVNTVKQYPGVNNEAEYSEQLLVGYRWYDENSENPLFPFGHGLSYTTFEYSNLHVAGNVDFALVTVDITNTGTITGAEVPQLYLAFPASAGEPPKLLKGFKKLELRSGATERVAFQLHRLDFSIWDVKKHDWSVVPGTFHIAIGSSSRNIRDSVTFTVA